MHKNRILAYLCSGMKKQLSFPSLVGFTLTAGEDGQKVTIATLLNCRDENPQELKLFLIQSTLDDIIYPEIIKRAVDSAAGRNDQS
jgi:hypothetical protein